MKCQRFPPVFALVPRACCGRTKTESVYAIFAVFDQLKRYTLDHFEAEEAILRKVVAFLVKWLVTPIFGSDSLIGERIHRRQRGACWQGESVVPHTSPLLFGAAA